MKTVNTNYDLDVLISSAKKSLKNTIVLLVVYALLLIASVLAIILWGDIFPIFIIAAASAVAILFLAAKKFKGLEYQDYKTMHGEIADVLKESTTKRSITGGYGMYVTRKYDAFAKEAIKLTVSVRSLDSVHSYELNRVTEEHLKYYEAKGEAIHIWGTHFPVKLEIGAEKWLCPICGEFNTNEKKICERCKKKVIK